MKLSAALLASSLLAVLIAGCGSTDAVTEAGGTASVGAGTGAMTGATTGGTGTGGAGGVATTASSVSSSSSSAGGGSSVSTGTGGSGGFTTVFTIVLENHDYNEVVGSPDAPYMNSLIAQYGLATNYMDSGTHPSLPNYLYMVSGDTQYPGVIDVNPDWVPYFPSDGDNLGHQLTVAGIKWRSYQESMGTPCLLDTSGDYAPKHDPFLYFDNIQNGPNALCSLTNVDYSLFAGNLANGMYRYMWITPNLINDGHDPADDPALGLQQSDAWMATEVPKILASDVFQAGGVLFITWDEAEGHDGNSGDQIPMIVVSPKLVSAGFKSITATDHASYLATVEEIFGLPKLGAAAQAETLMEFFQ